MVTRGTAARSSTSALCRARSARPGIAAYAATKGALKMLTKGMCADLGRHGIQVNAIGPGTSPPSSPRRWWRRRSSAHGWPPDAGRAVGEVDDLIGPLLFLSSRGVRLRQRAIALVDGGMLSVL